MLPVLIAAVVMVLVGAALVAMPLPIDWSPGRYKVIFHSGPDIGIETKVATGKLVVEGDQIVISGPQALSLALGSVRSIEPFRLHGLGQMVRVTHDQGTLFLSVVRLCIAGQFAIIDYFKTRKLTRVLGELVKQRKP